MHTGTGLKHTTPESVGITSISVSRFIDSIREKGVNLHSFILMRHGRIAAEGYYKPFSADLRHNVYSVTKSFVSAAVGIAVDRGMLSLDEKAVGFFPEKSKGGFHRYIKAITVKDLLTMSSVYGVQFSNKTNDWVEEYLNATPDHHPSTVFAYDSNASYLLCAILQKLAGMTVHDFLKKELFDCIGIGEIEWSQCPAGINIGGSGIRCTTRDMARFGQFCLQKGSWNGKQLISEEWMKASTSKQIDCSNTEFVLDGRTGYGYQFWMCRNNSYCAFGTGGQFILIIPEIDTVFVTTANTRFYKNGHQLILDSLWEVLYPGISKDIIPEAPKDHAHLCAKLEKLTLLLPDDNGISEEARNISGRIFRFNPNHLGYTGFSLNFSGECPLLELLKGPERTKINFDYNSWTACRDPFMGHEAIAGGVWVDGKRFAVHIQLMDALQMFMLTFGFSGEEATLQIQPGGALKGAGEFACILCT